VLVSVQFLLLCVSVCVLVGVVEVVPWGLCLNISRAKIKKWKLCVWDRIRSD
jgi:hypothetical protein